jgi:hypothetical protein
MARPHLFIATPCHGGQVMIEHLNSVLELDAACRGRGIGCQVEHLEDDRIIARARARLAARFLADRQATHLLFLDADIGFAPQNIFRLLDAKRAIVAGVCPIKHLDWERIRAAALAGAQDLQGASATYVVRFLPNADNAVEVSDDGFAPVAYAGTGVLLISREALQRVVEAHPELVAEIEDGPTPMVFEPIIEPETGQYLSEDYAFCRRFRDLGGEIWVDVESRYAHVGRGVYRGALIQALKPG